MRRNIAPIGWLLVAGGVIGAAIGLSPSSHADPVVNYAAAMAPAICQSLDNIPSMSNVSAILDDVVADTGFSYYQAGQVVGASVKVVCPRNWPVLQRFIDAYSPQVSQTYVASSKVGGRVG